VPKGRLRCAAVNPSGLNFSPLAVREQHLYQEAFPVNKTSFAKADEGNSNTQVKKTLEIILINTPN
jgi:hypothetical protein